MSQLSNLYPDFTVNISLYIFTRFYLDEIFSFQCEDNGFLSTLASVHSYFENKMLLDRLNLKGYGNKNVWIGLYRSALGMFTVPALSHTKGE